MKVSNIFDEYDVLQSDPKYGDKYADEEFGFENIFEKLYISDPWFVERKDLLVTGTEVDVKKATDKKLDEDDEEDGDVDGQIEDKDGPTVLTFKYIPPARLAAEKAAAAATAAEKLKAQSS